MAYNQQQNRTNSNGQRNGTAGGGGNRPQTSGGGGGGAPRKFEEDPNELGIGYEKEASNGGKYITFTVKKDVPAGTKVVVFQNNAKNKTEKTPTHRLKLSVSKTSA